MTDQPRNPYPVGTMVRLSLPGEWPRYGIVAHVCQDGHLIVRVGAKPHHETFIRLPEEVCHA